MGKNVSVEIMRNKKQLIKTIKTIFLDTLRADDVSVYQNDDEKENIECIVCKKEKPKYYYASMMTEEYVDGLPGEEGDLICNYVGRTSSFHRNYEEALYYDIIDTICKECVDVQLLLPDDSFYNKIYNYTKTICQEAD